MAVANTIGHEVVAANAINLVVLLAALSSAILWNLLTWYLGFPSSSSHALIGGFIGAVVIDAGWQAIHLPGHRENIDRPVHFPDHRIRLWLHPAAPDHAFLLESHPERQPSFSSAARSLLRLALALSHGTNDAQKTMGIITLALVTGGYLKVFAVPIWVIILCAAMIALGHCSWRKSS